MKNTIKVQRAIHDLTQAALAKKVDVSTWTINAMEANKYAPSVVLAFRIAELFGVPPEQLFILEDSDRKKK
ncbi:helix-turn-helix transcriptional regulator [soil metagenome]